MQGRGESKINDKQEDMQPTPYNSLESGQIMSLSCAKERANRIVWGEHSMGITEKSPSLVSTHNTSVFEGTWLRTSDDDLNGWAGRDGGRRSSTCAGFLTCEVVYNFKKNVNCDSPQH